VTAMDRRILVVDDDYSALRVIGYALKQEGYEVLTAAHGQAALRMAPDADLVILDIMMPDIDGYKICRRLRSNPETSDIPVIMLSAKAQVPDKLVGFEAGADDYVVKPVDPSELVARVTALLSRSRVSSPREARVISFIGVKGGVGTTTVAVNQAVAFGQLRAAVVLVDWRSSFGMICSLLGLVPKRTLADMVVADPKSGEDTGAAAYLTPFREGIAVLAGPLGFGLPRAVPKGLARSVIRQLKTMADYVLVDLPAEPSGMVRDMLEETNSIVLVSELEPLSLKSGAALVSSLTSWGLQWKTLGVVFVNRAWSENTMSATDAASALGVDLLTTLPPAAEMCYYATLQGKPVLLSQPDSLVSSTLSEFAVELRRKVL
jgi:CheY-like chemotaxis protein/MinD-like ATPase involved in chromosome partitioning or flagellar assembly